MNNIVEFMRFPPLGWVDRFRLGITVLEAQLIRDWHNLEDTSIEKWLLDLSGRRTYENIWRPMLNAKFDGSFENTRATWIWSRLVRMKSTHSGASQKEEAGYLLGGYTTLIQTLAERIRAAGCRIHLNEPVTQIIIEQNKAIGISTGGGIHTFDKLIFTAAPPIASRLIPQADRAYRESLARINYLGIICPLLVLDRPLTGYWVLNLTDDDLPFTGCHRDDLVYRSPAGGRALSFIFA
jgi:protoporphyrinogen oxidase